MGLPSDGGGIGITDDFAGLMGPALFREHAVSAWQRYYDALRAERRSLHSELLTVGHLVHLDALHLDWLNLGEDQFVTPRDVRRATMAPLTWNVKTTTMRWGTPETIRQEYLSAVADGAPAMMTDLCARGVPDANIRAFMAVAAEHGPCRQPRRPRPDAGCQPPA
jgi:hypothetical protein